MKQRMGKKKVKKVEAILGQRVQSAYTRGGWPHFECEAWVDPHTCYRVNYKTGENCVQHSVTPEERARGDAQYLLEMAGRPRENQRVVCRDPYVASILLSAAYRGLGRCFLMARMMAVEVE